MRNNALIIFLSLILTSQGSRADEIDDLQTKTKLDQARTIAYDAEAKKIKAEAELKKALLDATALQLSGESSLTTQEVNTDFAKFQALKLIFGQQIQDIGKAGNLTLGATDPILLTTRAASALTVFDAAKKVCSALKSGNVKDAFLVPDDFQARLMEARSIKRQIDTYEQTTGQALNSFKTIETQGLLPSVAAGALSAKFLVGVIQDFSKLFRTDRAVTSKDDFSVSRQKLFDWVLPASCEAGIFAPANTSMQRFEQSWAEFERLAESIRKIDTNLYELTGRKDDLTRSIALIRKDVDRITVKLEKLTVCIENEKKTAADRNSCASKEAGLQKEIDDLELEIYGQQKIANDSSLLITKITPWLTGIAANQKAIFDAATAISLGDSVSKSDWINYEVVTQDIQQTKDGALTGKRLFGTGSIEVKFRAISAMGVTKTSGFVSITDAPKRIDLDQNEYSSLERIVP